MDYPVPLDAIQVECCRWRRARRRGITVVVVTGNRPWRRHDRRGGRVKWLHPDRMKTSVVGPSEQRHPEKEVCRMHNCQHG